MLQKEHPVYLETVTFRNIARFTLLQLLYMLAVWGVTWAGAVGIAFPFLIVLLIPGRQYLMPKVCLREVQPVPTALALGSRPPACGASTEPALLCQQILGARIASVLRMAFSRAFLRVKCG